MRDSLGGMPRDSMMPASRLILALALLAGCAHPTARPVEPLAAPEHGVTPMPGEEPPQPGTPIWHDYLRRQTDSLLARDPRAEAVSAVRRGDFHLLAVYGIYPVVPRLEHEWPRYAYPIYVFRATSDALKGEDHARYCSVAYDFAKAYNAVILAHVLKRAQ